MKINMPLNIETQPNQNILLELSKNKLINKFLKRATKRYVDLKRRWDQLRYFLNYFFNCEATLKYIDFKKSWVGSQPKKFFFFFSNPEAT